MSGLMFGLLALLLIGPVPSALSAANWPQRAPRAALVLWQAIAIAAVLSAFSTGLAIASRLLVMGSDGRRTIASLDEIGTLGWPLWSLYVLVFALTMLVGARLIFAIVRLGFNTRRRRARHRMIVDLLDHPMELRGRPGAASLRILDTTQPVAYCLPGIRHRIVLSEGTYNALGDAEIHAVLAHERAHLRVRHDLVLEAFTAVYQAFPRIVRSQTALGSVCLLIEMLADDSARRVAGTTPLARALVACAGVQAPAGAMALGGSDTLIRIQRLGLEEHNSRVSVVAYTAAAALLVLPTIAVALPWLNEFHRLLVVH